MLTETLEGHHEWSDAKGTMIDFLEFLIKSEGGYWLQSSMRF